VSLAASDSGLTGPLPPRHVDNISSVNNPYVKHCVKLSKRSYREQVRSVLLCGEILLNEVVNGCDDMPRARVLLVNESTPDVCIDGLAADRVVYASEHVMAKIAGVENAAGLGAIAEMYAPQSASAEVEASLLGNRILILDGVQDPGNVGTLLRTAVALGWSSVVLMPSCCDAFNDKALRAARGATFKLPVVSCTWDVLRQVAESGGVHLLAADIRADSANLEPFLQGGALAHAPVGLVLGSEGQGLSEAALMACTSISIPMAGNMESLNVGIAGGILMYILQTS